MINLLIIFSFYHEWSNLVINLSTKASTKKLISDLPKPDDTFVEKLTTQIIKNVQINIKDIHIRYEDKITLPSNPFSAGITLHSLTIYTTNASKEKHIANDEDARIFKVVNFH